MRGQARARARPVEETGPVITVREARFLPSAPRPFPPDIHWKLPMGMWNESGGHNRFSFPVCTTSHSTDQSKMLSGFLPPFFSLSPLVLVSLLLYLYVPFTRFTPPGFLYQILSPSPLFTTTYLVTPIPRFLPLPLPPTFFLSFHFLNRVATCLPPSLILKTQSSRSFLDIRAPEGFSSCKATFLSTLRPPNYATLLSHLPNFPIISASVSLDRALDPLV